MVDLGEFCCSVAVQGVLLRPTTGALLTVVAMADAGSDPGLLPPAVADVVILPVTTLVATMANLPFLERIFGVDLLASTGRRPIALESVLSVSRASLGQTWTPCALSMHRRESSVFYVR